MPDLSHYPVETYDSATAVPTLGTVITAHFPDDQHRAMFRLVRVVDNGGSDGDVMCMASSTSWDVTNDRTGGSAIEDAGNLQKGVGVLVGTITVNQYGWMLVSGIHDAVKTDGNVLIGRSLKLDNGLADGQCMMVAAGSEQLRFGHALAADVGNVVKALIECM